MTEVGETITVQVARGPDTGCVICTLPAATDRWPPVCVDCRRDPLGTENSVRACLDALGATVGRWDIPFTEEIEGGRLGRRFRGLRLIVLGVVEDLQDLRRTHPHTSGGPPQEPPARLTVYAPMKLRGEGEARVLGRLLRAVVFFPDSPMFVEVRAETATGSPVVRAEYVPPDEWDTVPRRQKLALDLLKLTRGPGAEPQDRRERDEKAKKALKLKRDYPYLTWDDIAKYHIKGVKSGSTVERWVREYREVRDRHPERE